MIWFPFFKRCAFGWTISENTPRSHEGWASLWFRQVPQPVWIPYTGAQQVTGSCSPCSRTRIQRALCTSPRFSSVPQRAPARITRMYRGLIERRFCPRVGRISRWQKGELCCGWAKTGRWWPTRRRFTSLGGYQVGPLTFGELWSPFLSSICCHFSRSRRHLYRVDTTSRDRGKEGTRRRSVFALRQLIFRLCYL